MFIGIGTIVLIVIVVLNRHDVATALSAPRPSENFL
jgi:hypothetical protein